MAIEGGISLGEDFLYVFKPRPKCGARDGAACTGKRASLPPAALKGRDGGGAGGATRAQVVLECRRIMQVLEY
jgi:hypothetical protein